MKHLAKEGEEQTLTVQFKVQHSPDTEKHLEQVLSGYFRGKGVDYKNKTIYI